MGRVYVSSAQDPSTCSVTLLTPRTNKLYDVRLLSRVKQDPFDLRWTINDCSHSGIDTPRERYTNMPRLNLDILYEIVDQVSGFDCKNRRAILLSLALTCRDVNNSIRPILFHRVNWPHPDKFDQESGLLFFPEALWPYFK
jgi:hypothetical protein